MARRLNEFEKRYDRIAEPFGWNFTRQKLDDMLTRLSDRQARQVTTAA